MPESFYCRQENIPMGLLVGFFFVSILFSFLCSILEAVLLSITPAYVGIQEQKGSHVAADLVRFKDDIDRPLAAILTLNTIAHTVGAIGVGSQAALIFGESMLEIAGVPIISLEALIAGLMTLAILIFSEVIPKTIGANNWETLTPFTIASLKVMLFVLAPLVWISQYITRHLKKDKDKPVLSRTDFLAMAKLGTESGVLEESEQTIIHNLLRFSKVLVKDVMTPRIVVNTACEDISVREFQNLNANLPHSRIPVYRKKNDNITGYVLRDDILLNLAETQDHTLLKALRRDIVVVHRTVPIPDLLDTFLIKKEHMALVVDEFGGMEGIVTMEDIIETLLGLEIVDESDNETDMQALARSNWERRAERLGILPKTGEPGTSEGDKNADS